MTDFRPGGFQQLPTVVKNIIIINVLVFLLRYALETRGIDLDVYLGLHYWQSSLFRWWQPLTHLFMHGSIAHIFFNMFALWMFGRILENIWGPQRFLLFYLVCGFGAAICHMGVLTFEYMPMHHGFIAYQQHPGILAFIDFANKFHISPNPEFISAWGSDPTSNYYISGSIKLLDSLFNEATIGASGAVMGLLFAFGYLFPNTLLYLYFAIPVKAKWFVAGYALLELYSGIRNSAGDNIAHFAHLGGMLFAFILLRIWNDKVRNRFY